MSRNAFFDALAGDPVLNSLGLQENTIFPNYGNEERPSDEGLFIILRWGETDRPPFRKRKAPEPVAVWVHLPREISKNDFQQLIDVLDRIDEVVDDLRDTAGSDGRTLSFVTIGGRSRDLTDDGFNTITKYGDYQVYSRKS